MKLRVAGIGLVVAVLLTSAAVRAIPAMAPGRCPSDSKLLNGGPTAVFGEGSGTFWGLVVNGLNAAGFATDAEKLAYLNTVFGTDFGTLAEVKAFNLQLLSDTWDINQNGFVCAFELRGVRAYFGDSLLNLTTFGVSDDRIGK